MPERIASKNRVNKERVGRQRFTDLIPTLPDFIP